MNLKQVSLILSACLVVELLEPCLSQGDYHHDDYGYSGRRRGGRGGGGGGDGLGNGLGALLGVAAAGIGAAAITRGITGIMGRGRGFGGQIGGFNGGYVPAYPYGSGGFVQGTPVVGGGGFYPTSGGFPPYYPQQPMYPFQQPVAISPAVIPSGQESHDRGSRRVLIEENFDRGQGSSQGTPVLVGQPVWG
ncbi:hypothetical protein DPMN_120367 [Dreissena polymorpha]|uniref:Uncharacterized protein n=2 Tax=Dreissena polymorpha TaxID=45954 RepID=A0A9D4JNH2_DREPO|nr:hypothetical protein DPMN_120367 [Dreissena polymorpha]